MIRPATFSDIPAILELVKLGHQRSPYAKHKLDDRAVKAGLLASIQRHGARQEGGCYVGVAEVNEVLVGVILGTLQRPVDGLDVLEAVERYWIVKGIGHGPDAEALLLHFHHWARSVRGVVAIRHSLADRTSGLTKSVTEMLLKRAGLKRGGTIFEMET